MHHRLQTTFMTLTFHHSTWKWFATLRPLMGHAHGTNELNPSNTHWVTEQTRRKLLTKPFHLRIRTTCVTLTFDLLTRKWYATHRPLMGHTHGTYELNPSNSHRVRARTRRKPQGVADRQTDKHTDRQTDNSGYRAAWQTDRQTNTQTDRRTTVVIELLAAAKNSVLDILHRKAPQMSQMFFPSKSRCSSASRDLVWPWHWYSGSHDDNIRGRGKAETKFYFCSKSPRRSKSPRFTVYIYIYNRI